MESDSDCPRHSARLLFLPVANSQWPVALLHGQSFEGLMNDPPVRRDASQKALGADGSPSIGIRMTLSGTPFGYFAIARSKNFNRSSPSMVLRINGALVPCVGRPSVMRMTLSGFGFIAF